MWPVRVLEKNYKKLGFNSGPITQAVFTVGERLLSVLLSLAFIEHWLSILAAHMNHLEELLENTNI